MFGKLHRSNRLQINMDTLDQHHSPNRRRLFVGLAGLVTVAVILFGIVQSLPSA